jgi:hypothetical protein
MYISESAIQGQPVGIYPFLWVADVSSNPNAETMQLLGGGMLQTCFHIEGVLIFNMLWDQQ